MIVGKVDAISLEFKWEIDNFSTRCQDVGDFLESPRFKAITNSINWDMWMFPYGATEADKNYLSIELYAFGDKGIKAVNTFTILNNEGEVMVTDTTEQPTPNSQNGANWSSNKFVSREFVTNPVNGILNDDKLTIVCKIRYVDSEIKCKATKHEVKDDVSPRLEDKYEALLTDNKFSDVSLIAEGKAMQVHKCILAKSSSVFSAMFDAEMKEKQDNTVDIVDIKYNVLVEMIRFIYAGKVNDIDTLAGELAIAADKYALDGLTNMCEKTMIKNLNVDNVVSCLQLADSLRMDELKNKAIKFIVDKASDLSDKSAFDCLSRDIVWEIFRGLAEKSK